MLALLLLRLVRFDVRQMLLVCRCSNDCGGVLLNPRDPFKGSASTFGENRRIAHAAILLQRCECLAENLLVPGCFANPASSGMLPQSSSNLSSWLPNVLTMLSATSPSACNCCGSCS